MVSRHEGMLGAVAIAWVLSPCSVRAQLELPSGIELTFGAATGVSYDDNALLGRRGQFLTDAAGGRKHDVAARQSIEAELSRLFGEEDRLTLGGRLDLALVRTVSELAGYDVSARLAHEKAIGPDVAVVPDIRVAYHREDPSWTSRAVAPGLRGRYFFSFGLMSDLGYRYSRVQFALLENGQGEPKTSYANIDREEQVVDLDLRLWPHRLLRTRLQVEARATRYANNLSPNLADYAELAPGTTRVDYSGGLTATVLFTPRPWAVVTGGVRCEINRSNSRAFTFNACHALLDGLVTLLDRSTVYIALDYAQYDFPDEQFDRRYLNTRRDLTRGLTVAYGFEITEQLNINIRFGHLRNVSNDCSDFDPERTELGLPVYSRSYSCYGQTRIEAFLRYQS